MAAPAHTPPGPFDFTAVLVPDRAPSVVDGDKLSGGNSACGHPAHREATAYGFVGPPTDADRKCGGQTHHLRRPDALIPRCSRDRFGRRTAIGISAGGGCDWRPRPGGPLPGRHRIGVSSGRALRAGKIQPSPSQSRAQRIALARSLPQPWANRIRSSTEPPLSNSKLRNAPRRGPLTLTTRLPLDPHRQERLLR